MRFSLPLLLASVALVAASCDTSEPPPDPPDPGPWALGDCVDAPGVAALFVGGPDFTCVSAAGKSESNLFSLGYIGGELYFNARGDHKALLVLDDTRNFGLAHSLDLKTGSVTRHSVDGAMDSQIARAGPDRFLITDVLSNVVESDTARFVFSFLEGDALRTTLRLEVPGPGVGDASFLDVDYDAASNTSAHLFLLGTDVCMITVDHDSGTYRMEDLSYVLRPSFVRYRPDGELLLLDRINGTVHSVTDGGALVLDIGGRMDEATGRALFEDGAGEVYTFTSDASGARVYRLASGGVEEVLTLDRPQRYMYVSASAEAVCLREFRPVGWAEPTYDDVVSVFSLRDGTLTTKPVTLRTDYYAFPRFACL